jgi:hypothetical protein
MPKPSRFVLLLLGPLTLAATFAAAQTREGVRTDITVSGAVTAVDHTARTVTMRAKEGHLVTVDVPPSATRFAQVKVGDTVTISYYDRVIIRLKPAGEPAVDRTLPPTTTPAAGSVPGGTLASQRTVTVTLTGCGMRQIAWCLSMDPMARVTRAASWTRPIQTSSQD